jgi:hypothetical protein
MSNPLAEPSTLLGRQEPRFASWDYARWTKDECSRLPGTNTWTTGWLQTPYAQQVQDHPAVVAEITAQHEARTMLPFRRREFEAIFPTFRPTFPLTS